LGFEPNPYRFFRAADCVALSSDWEGLPNALMEAMACGTAPVATRCDFGPEELIEDGVTGLLVPPGDERAMAEALERLAASPERRERMGAAARQRIRDTFDVGPVTAQFESLLQDLTQRSDS